MAVISCNCDLGIAGNCSRRALEKRSTHSEKKSKQVSPWGKSSRERAENIYFNRVRIRPHKKRPYGGNCSFSSQNRSRCLLHHLSTTVFRSSRVTVAGNRHCRIFRSDLIKHLAMRDWVSFRSIRSRIDFCSIRSRTVNSLIKLHRKRAGGDFLQLRLRRCEKLFKTGLGRQY